MATCRLYIPLYRLNKCTYKRLFIEWFCANCNNKTKQITDYLISRVKRMKTLLWKEKDNIICYNPWTSTYKKLRLSYINQHEDWIRTQTISKSQQFTASLVMSVVLMIYVYKVVNQKYEREDGTFFVIRILCNN